MRAIDADALLDCIQERLRILRRKTARLSDIVAEVNTQPTIPERMAGTRKRVSGVLFCDTCNEMVDKKYNYCPNCGAKFKEADHG